MTSNGTAWRLDCDPVARSPNGGAGGPTLWPAELVVLASSRRFAGGGDAAAEPWTEADAPAWIPLLLRVSEPHRPLGSGGVLLRRSKNGRQTASPCARFC